MSELTFGMRLTYSGSEANAALEQTRAKVDAISTSSERLARQNAMMGQTFKQSSTEIKDTEASVRRLLDRYDPLGAKLRQLQDDFKKLDAAAAGGKIAGSDDARVDQVYANLQKQIAAASAATDGYAAANGKAALSAGQLRMATQQLPMQFTDIWVSLAAGQSPMMVMLQQGTQIKDSFGGILPALRAMGGYMSGLINPVTLVTGALIAGGVAWYNWGESAQEAMDKASARLKEAEKDAQAAAGGVQHTTSEQIKGLEGKRDGVIGQLEAARKRLAGVNRETDAKLALAIGQEVIARKQELADYNRQIADLKKQQAEEEKRLAGKAAKSDSKANKEDETRQANIDKVLNGEADKYDKLAMMAQGYLDDEQTRAGRKLSYDLLVMEKEYQANVALLEKNKATQAEKDQLDKTYQDAKAARAEQTWAEIEKIEKDSIKKSGAIWETFRDSTQRTLGDVLYQGMTGNFGSIEDAFKQMFFRIAANAASARLTEAMFGTGTGGDNGWMGGLMKAFGFADGGAFGVHAFANGGTFSNGLYTQPTPFKFANGGGFSLGVMGEAGPEAVMPLARDSSGKLGVRAQGGGGTTVVIQDHTTINVDSRADRAQVLSDVSRLIDSRQGQLVERLRREKAIA